MLRFEICTLYFKKFGIRYWNSKSIDWISILIFFALVCSGRSIPEDHTDLQSLMTQGVHINTHKYWIPFFCQQLNQ